MLFVVFVSYFYLIDEFCQVSKIIYLLFDVLFLIVVVVIVGVEGWEDIEDFGCCYLDWFK